MSGPLRIHSIALAGFRGARDPIGISLDKPLNIIFGPNGSGKSTLTTAIEYALFPRECLLQTAHGIDERRHWEVKNVHSNGRFDVEVVFADGEKKVTVRPHRDTRDNSASPIQCGYQEFSSLVLVHQETIRDFLVGQPAVRQSAFQRLLGAGWAQDLSKAIQDATKRLHREEADRCIQSLEVTLNARLEEARRLLTEAELAADRDAISRPWPEAARSVTASVRSSLVQLCRELDMPEPRLPDPDSLAGYSTGAVAEIDRLRTLGPGKRHADLSGRRVALESLRNAYRQALKESRRHQAEHQDRRTALGTEDTLLAKRASLLEKQSEVQRNLARLSRERAVVREAVAYFKEEVAASCCPVCRQPVSHADILAELRSRIENSLTADERDHTHELARLSDELGAVNGAVFELSRIADSVRFAAEQEAGQRGRVVAELGAALTSGDDPSMMIDESVRQAEEEFLRSRNALATYQSRLSAIEAEARKADLIHRALSQQERLDHLSRIRESGGWAKAISAHRELSRRDDLLKSAVTAARALAVQISENQLQRARDEIAANYARLTQRCDFPEVRIDSTQKFAISVRGSAGPFQATAVLNVTDLSSLALSVIAAMALTFHGVHGLGFLILDDPSQGMDPDVSRRLGSLLVDLSGSLQIVVATPDPSLLSALCQSTRPKNVIRLAPRDAHTEVPSIRIESLDS